MQARRFHAVIWTMTEAALLAGFVALFSGCTVGPDFHRPALPANAGYTARPLTATPSVANVPGGGQQRFVMGLEIPREWWALFKSKPLDALIERSLKKSPTIAAARAALRQARESVYAQAGAYYPVIQAAGSISRARDSGVISPTPASNEEPYSLATAQVSVDYAPDIFGGNRRQVESLEAQANFQYFQLEAAYLALTSNVVAAAIQEASLRAQISATLKIIGVQTGMLGLLRRQLSLGYVAGADVAAQEAALAQARQALPPLRRQLAQTRDLLAALAGGFPNGQMEEEFDLDSLVLPRALPVSLPSRLVEQRPDVRAALAQLHAACAQIGVAASAQLPDITLSADLGSTAARIGRLFTAGTGLWSLAGNIAQTLFDGGALRHRRRAAEAGLDLAEAQYRGTVIAAFQNVADILHALKCDADALKAAVDFERASGRSLDLARRQFELGYVNYLSLLSAEQSYQQAVINVVQARANRFADTAALFMALGGGWWHNRDKVPEAQKNTLPCR
ncbi:MAG: efflux transporter outer membrane subunit [Nitrospiraceae bacterium]|nr:efflux transporter outer membrane subunit [Nitrospiraceae bacterium]